MRKFFFFVLSLTLFLTACGAQATTTPALIPTATATRVAPKPATAYPSVCADARQATPDPNEPSLFPRVSADDHMRGAENPAVTVIMYSDFQCSDCAIMAPALETIRQKYPDVRIVYRHLPQPGKFDKALVTIQAAEAASLQGKFWELHDLLFAQQSEWATLTPDQFTDWIKAHAAETGLDADKFALDLANDQVKKNAEAASQASQQFSQLPLPLLLINNEIIRNAYVLVNLENLVRLYALPARQFSTCPPFAIDPEKVYTATLKTTKGEIVITLFANKTPNTVNNFIFLARQGWYDNVAFHRVIPGFVAQTGDPSGTGMGNPGYFIPNEINLGLQYDRAGMVGMANAGPDTNGSQFFITYGPAPSLDSGYTIFGEVESGLDVLSSLTPRDPAAGGSLPDPDLLISITIEEK